MNLILNIINIIIIVNNAYSLNIIKNNQSPSTIETSMLIINFIPEFDHAVICVTWSWFCSIVVQLCLCCCWNFGWYGSNILIFPHRLKNNAIAAAQRRRTSITIKASSALTMTAVGPGISVQYYLKL